MRASVIVAAGVAVIAAGALAWFLFRPSSPAPMPAAAGAAEPAVTLPRSVPAPAPAAVPREEAPAVGRTAPRPAAALAPVAAAPKTASLRVEVDVTGATVFIDRVGVGTAPITIPDLDPGSHTVSVSATGYDRYTESVELEAGKRTISVAFKQIRLDAKIDVVHKHGMGSCKGQLSASPEGLRYAATDGKDNFAAAFTELDAFEVDYLAKNLRVKTKQGRTFNFSDPDGNADRLFVFHRDVEKARARLSAR